jgi:TRAP transporter TAXI family solute receptor
MRFGPLARAYLLIALALVLGLAIAYRFVEPAPPSRIVMATGPEGGAYRGYSEAYRAVFARNGVELELRASAGSVENLALLRDGAAGVAAALVQGGLADPGGESGVLQTLGGMFVEPLWLFTRLEPTPTRLLELAGRRIAVGAPGSGTRAQALKLLAGSGVNGGNATLIESPATEARAALAAGAADAVFLVGAASAEAVRELAHVPGAALVDYAHADAYAQVDRTVEAVTLARGALDFAADIPSRPVRMPATTADLVVRADLHPALKELLVMAAQEVHGPGSVLNPPGRFPSRYATALPLAPEAARFYENGPPFLQRYMPFWAATLVDRLAVLLIPLVTVLVSAWQVLPPLVTSLMENRVYRWYAPLIEVEAAVRGADAGRLEEARAELARIDREVSRIRIPASYHHLVFRLRSHLDLVRARVEALERSAGKG